MINLLDPAAIKEIRAARTNVHLRRYTVMALVTLSVIGAIYIFSFNKVSEDIAKTEANNATAEQSLKKYANAKTTTEEYRANLSIAKKILGNEITFSSFITELSSSLPANTILDNLDLSTEYIGLTNGKVSEVKLTARAKSYADVVSLKTSLEKKTNLFSNVRIISTALDESENAKGVAVTYPYSAVLGVTITTQQGGTK